MEKIIELFAFFLLTLLGFVTPIIAIILSIFAQALSKLSAQYETERKQTEEKLKNQLQKTAEDQSINLPEIKKTLRELQLVKKIAERKLQLLSPKKALIFICTPMATAFLLLLPPFIHSLPPFFKWLPLLSLLLVGYSLLQLWKVLDIVVEAMKIIETESKEERRVVPELLGEVVRNTKEGASYFIEDIFVILNNIHLKKDTNELKLVVNKKMSLSVSLNNNEVKMGKDIEAGFSFPTDFLIEKSNGYSIYAAGAEQIVRYSLSRIQASTNAIMSPLVLTPLKEGEYTFQIFIKGENIKTKYRKLKILVA